MKQLKAELSLFGITVFWGASFPIMSIALKYVPPYCFIALRNLLGALVLSCVFYKSFKNINKKVILAAILIGLSLFLGSVFQMTGLLYTTPSKSGFITGLNVIFVPLLIALIFKTLPDRKTVVGVILSIAGLALMSYNGIDGINLGDVLTLICAFCFSAQILLVDKFGGEVDPILLTILELFVVGILALIPSIFVDRLQVTINMFSMGAVAFTTVFCTALAMAVQNKMQHYTNPTHAAIIYLAEPVFGAIFSIFVGDILSGRTLWGGIIILFGMVVLSVDPKLFIRKAVVVENDD
jgi:drug/metabolite transporter (DMT)-like permease